MADVHVSKWNSLPQNKMVKGWSNEKFQRKRTTLHTSIYDNPKQDGTTRFRCHQQQFCRINKVAKECVFTTKCWTTDRWFSDLFEIHVRWVVTAMPVSNQVSVKIVLFVPILRHSQISGKIVAVGSSDMSKHQLALLSEVLSRVGGVGEENADPTHSAHNCSTSDLSKENVSAPCSLALHRGVKKGKSRLLLRALLHAMMS